MDDMSSLPTNHESFSSQQNYTMEDDTIDLDGVDLGSEPNHDKDIEKNDKKRKRKAPSKLRKCLPSVGNTLIQSLNLMKTGAILKCINGWGIKNVMTMTVDNIASNDKALEYLLENLPTKYDDGKHFHVRCMAYILNLVVKDGLKAYKKEVETIALAVKYIKHLSQRVTNFKESVENACTSKKFLISKCPTRWNSTHDMLKTAIELKDAFFDYDFNNSCFARDLEEIPKRADFEVCKKVVSFLEKFKETTELVSSVSSPVAHLWFGEILDIDTHLREWQENASFTGMISKMRPKYDKY
ncbi:zinc finger BED domain-containing protein RICESLEEPER 2 [Tanacetum coccineum]|uniref:Zinc finger BED domain-containing protein RICESLEEPER 2 n=1 Tax=Tanacetum coccineum TaxID=301880 RepID=A0ABQ5BAY2_9ASTR